MTEEEILKKMGIDPKEIAEMPAGWFDEDDDDDDSSEDEEEW